MTANNYLIVVGVDGSEGARSALRWAIHEARSRGGTVQTINAWRWDFPELRTGGTASRMAAAAEILMTKEIRALPPHEARGVPVTLEAVEGNPADVLVEAARGADLLVLGSHGRSRQLHQLLGSVSEACIRHAACPVVILPAAYAEVGEEQR